MKIVKYTVIVLIVFTLIYVLGPSPKHPIISNKLPAVSAEPTALEMLFKDRDAQHKIKAGNETEIVWADSTKKKTHYVILYTHGFGASGFEGFPMHKKLATALHCNLIIPRLEHHGIDTIDNMFALTADNLWESAKLAFAAASQMGDSVILMGTSTGCTLNLMLAAHFSNSKGIINLSPNIRLRDPLSFLLNNHWGKQIAQLAIGGNNVKYNVESEFAKYWYPNYRVESIVQLEELLESQMIPETFAQIHEPALNLYYYKNETEQDNMINVEKVKWMHSLLATPQNNKILVQMPNVGDHIMGNPIRSKDIDGVWNQITIFCNNILGIPIK